ncbi:MAG: manno-octulosonate cytidylyltransferase [Pseudomonadota bacterium]
MRVLILIPARYASSRFPGKPLAPLRGASGTSRSLIERTWRAAIAVGPEVRVVVATDDARIRAEAEAFGAEVVMTPPEAENGTARCAAALDALRDPAEIIVNLQGDAPLTPPTFVSGLIDAMAARPEIEVATPVLRCDAAALVGFLEDRAAGRVGATTAVFDATGCALYFSKEVIPYTGRPLGPDETIPVFHHAGVYAFRPAALRRYPALTPGPLEAWEGLEQLRFLENGHAVHCIEVAPPAHPFWELNNPVDVSRIERILAEQGME